jgi:hypothetical protein
MMLVCFFKVPPGVSHALTKTLSQMVPYDLGYGDFIRPSIVKLEGWTSRLAGHLSDPVVDLCLGLGVLESIW